MLASAMKDTISLERKSSNSPTNLEILEVLSLQIQEESIPDIVHHGEQETQLPSFLTAIMIIQRSMEMALTSITSFL